MTCAFSSCLELLEAAAAATAAAAAAATAEREREREREGGREGGREREREGGAREREILHQAEFSLPETACADLKIHTLRNCPTETAEQPFSGFLRFALLGSSFLGEKPWITARLGHGAILFDAWGAAAGCKSHQG